MIDNEDYLRAYFVNQSDYYIERYKYYHAGHKFNFSIVIFLCGMFWFLYRKLYVEFGLILAVLFTLSITEAMLFDALGISESLQQTYGYILTLVVTFIISMTGEYLYLRRADKRIKEVLDATDNEQERIALLTIKGGVSLIPFIVILLIILYLVIVNKYSI